MTFFVNLNVLAETIPQLLRTSERTGENTVTALELYQMPKTFWSTSFLADRTPMEHSSVLVCLVHPEETLSEITDKGTTYLKCGEHILHGGSWVKWKDRKEKSPVHMLSSRLPTTRYAASATSSCYHPAWYSASLRAKTNGCQTRRQNQKFPQEVCVRYLVTARKNVRLKKMSFQTGSWQTSSAKSLEVNIPSFMVNGKIKIKKEDMTAPEYGGAEGLSYEKA